MGRRHPYTQAIAQAIQGRRPVGHHQAALVIQGPGVALGQVAGGVGHAQRGKGAQLVITEQTFHRRQRVPGADHAQPVQQAHVAEAEVAGHRHRAGGADHDVGAFIGQRIPHAVVHLVFEQQFHFGKLPIEVEHQLPAALGFDDGVHGHLQLAAPTIGHLLAQASGAEHFFHHAAGFVDEQTPGGGQFHVAMPAHKQRHGQPFFELAHGVTDGRGDAVQFLGSGAEAAVTGDGVDHIQGIFRPHRCCLQNY